MKLIKGRRTDELPPVDHTDHYIDKFGPYVLWAVLFLLGCIAGALVMGGVFVFVELIAK